MDISESESERRGKCVCHSSRILQEENRILKPLAFTLVPYTLICLPQAHGKRRLTGDPFLFLSK